MAQAETFLSPSFKGTGCPPGAKRQLWGQVRGGRSLRCRHCPWRLPEGILSQLLPVGSQLGSLLLTQLGNRMNRASRLFHVAYIQLLWGHGGRHVAI